LAGKEIDPAGKADDQLQFVGHFAAVADDRHVFPLKKRGVACGAVTYAPADELFFSRDRAAAAESSGGDDDRAPLVCPLRRDHLFGVGSELGGEHLRLYHLSAKLLGLPAKPGQKLSAAQLFVDA